MIRHLRRKFILINMSLLVAMLLVIFGLVYHFTARDLENATMDALRTAASTQMRPGRPGTLDPGAATPCFTLEMNPKGELMAVGNGSFDLTDEAMLNRIYLLAKAGGQTGVLEEYALRYYRSDAPMGEKYAFADISGNRQTLNNLLKSCALVGVIAAAGLLVISVLLARWAVKPVDQAWKQQRQFVADASHELKTPLTVILTNAELLQSPEYGEGEKGRFSENILTMARQMRALVERLLELARADNGPVETRMEELDLSALVENALLPMEPLFYEQGLMLETAIEPQIRVRGNAGQLRQVAEILLDNARKYSDPGGTVRLSLEKIRGKALLKVESPGRTLTPEQCRQVFKRFYRADAARSRDGSFGLGLAIAEEMVSQHRGKIWAQGKEGVNTFFVSLPG